LSEYSEACIDMRAGNLLISADPDIVGLLRWRASGSHAGMSPPSGSAGQSAGAMSAGRVVLAGRRVKGPPGGRCGGAPKALGLRGTLRGRMVLGGADSGWPVLVCASVFAGQALYLGRGDRSAGHGNEKV
jgi:hypothetical protein